MSAKSHLLLLPEVTQKQILHPTAFQGFPNPLTTHGT